MGGWKWFWLWWLALYLCFLFPFGGWIPISFALIFSSFFCYIKSHRFFFSSTLFWMDGWMDGTNKRSYLVGVCVFFPPHDIFIFISFTCTGLLPLLLYLWREEREERQGGTSVFLFFFNLLYLNFYYFFVLYSHKTFSFPPLHMAIYRYPYIYLSSYLFHLLVCVSLLFLFLFFGCHWWLVLDSSGFRGCAWNLTYLLFIWDRPHHTVILSYLTRDQNL